MLTSPYVSPSDQSSLTTPSPSDDALIGRIIAGKFSIGERIGIGAAGTVYRAEQTSLGRTVAIKVLRPELAGDPRFIRRFHDEALAASRLNHPNVVSVIDFGQTDDGLLYLVMEFLRGTTLTQLLRTEELSASRIAEIIRQILSALEEAHACGVIHADLKSDNIIVEHRRGGWDLAKVVDFGIARLTGIHHEDASGEEDTICGTPEYMAPEIIRGEDPTPATDVYAVGIMLYELLVGYTPFSGAPVLEVLQRHIDELPIPPSQRGTTAPIPVYLEQATLQALQKNPEDRFSTALRFSAALTNAETTSLVDEVAIICTDCHTASSTRFKFCPECGAALPAPSTEFELALDDTGHEELWSDDSPTADLTLEDAHGILIAGETPEVEKRQELPILEADFFPLPLIGYELELAGLQTFISGRSLGLLYLRGPHGCGSSRLLREACERAASENCLGLLAGADPTDLKTPFYPIRAMVGAMLDLPSVCTYEQIGLALTDMGLNRRDLPGIGELFEHSSEGLRQLENVGRRRELFAATVRVFRKFAQRNSAVLIFEDFHLYDRPSQDLLLSFAESNHRVPAASIIISSDESMQLEVDIAMEHIDLAPLDNEELRGVVTYLATRGYPDLITLEELRRFTKGRPAAIQQLLRYAVEGGDLDGAPESLADLVAARIRGLPGVAQRVLQAAAVFGTEVVPDDLMEILETRMGRVEMNAALHLLEKREMLSRQPDMFVFNQKIVRNVSYEATPKHVRKNLHQLAGDILIATISDPAILGMHAEQAGSLIRAAELLTRGGDNAVARLDDKGAAQIYQRALQATRSILLNEEDSNAQLRFVAISIKLADALRVTDEIGLARGVLFEAKEHCQRAPSLRAQLLRAEAQLRASELELSHAISLFRQAIALAIPIFAMDILTDTYLDLATMLLRNEERESAITELEEAIDLITMGEGAAAQTAPKNFWRILLRLGQLYSEENNDKAIAITEHAVRLAGTGGSTVGVARAFATLAGLYESTGDSQKSSDYRKKAIEEMRRLGDRRTTAELLLSGCKPTQTIHRITPSSIREAKLLAEEVGWDEGVRRARRASSMPN